MTTDVFHPQIAKFICLNIKILLVGIKEQKFISMPINVKEGESMSQLWVVGGRVHPPYPSLYWVKSVQSEFLSQLLNKKGYLRYLPHSAAPRLKAFPPLSKTHLPSLGPGETRLVKLPPRGKPQMEESISLQQSHIKQNWRTKGKLFAPPCVFFFSI